LRLDAWVPKGKGPFPSVIIVHGGGFVRGDKQSYVRPLFDVLARAGFAWFTVDYRLAPGAKYPAAVDDVQAAVAWVHRNARRYRVDRKRVALLGESAGGFIVSAVGVRHKRGGPLAAVLPFYTYHEFKLPAPSPDGKVTLPARGALVDFFGVRDASDKTAAFLRAAAPLHAVRDDLPPFLLYHSKDDPQVPYAQSVAMCEAMHRAGASCTLFTAEALGHGLGKWKETPAEHVRLLEWLRRTLGSGG
jgi:alpha-L-fucosidase 2